MKVRASGGIGRDTGRIYDADVGYIGCGMEGYKVTHASVCFRTFVIEAMGIAIGYGVIIEIVIHNLLPFMLVIFSAAHLGLQNLDSTNIGLF